MPDFLNNLEYLDEGSFYTVTLNESCTLSNPDIDSFWVSEICSGICQNGECIEGILSGDLNAYGEICGLANNCEGDLLCKPSGRYGEEEKYCCKLDECASVFPDNNPLFNCVGDGGVDEGLDSAHGSYFLTCDNGMWYSTN